MRSVEIAKQCRAKCVGVKDRCCFNDCFFEIGEVMIDGKFNDEKFRGLYDADMARKSNVDWKNVIESSMETCKKLSMHEIYLKNRTRSKNKSFAVPETTQFDSNAEMPCNKSSLMYPRMLSSCIRQLNFVNCPSIDDSDRCKASKEFVANNKLCGSKVGEFFMIFSDFFFIPKIMKKPEKVEMQTKTTLSSSNEQE